MPLLKEDKNIERSIRRAVNRPGGSVDRYTGTVIMIFVQLCSVIPSFAKNCRRAL
ncbi:MAG: hypothetical protein LBC04_00395 [Holosporaceae bacterium]|jgi:hypothetical protein|nr:hypothetical protein [Holosporaceae bacterium]